MGEQSVRLRPGRARVAQLSSVHPPFDSRIFVKISRSLARAGYEVDLVVQHDRAEVRDGVRIVPISFSRTRTERLIVGGIRVFAKALRSRARIVHFHDPELIPTAFLLKAFGFRVIYDVHEDVPRQVMDKYWIAPWLRSAISKAVSGIERVAGGMFDRIVAATPAIAARFPPSKTIIVRNFPSLDEFDGLDPADYDSRPHSVAYIGGINFPRGALQMVQAIAAVDVPGAELHLAGPIAPTSVLDRLEKESGWSRTRWHGVLDRSGVKHLLNTARVGLVLLHPTAAFLPSLPVKLFEYMAAGIPIIASDFPDWRPLVADTGAGLLVDPLNVTAIAEAIEWLLANPGEARNMGERGRKAVLTHYNWRSEEAKLLAAYEGIE